MNVSSHHTGNVIAYKLQIKLKNTDFFTVLLKFIYGFLVFGENYREEQKVSEEIERLAFVTNDFLNIGESLTKYEYKHIKCYSDVHRLPIHNFSIPTK